MRKAVHRLGRGRKVHDIEPALESLGQVGLEEIDDYVRTFLARINDGGRVGQGDNDSRFTRLPTAEIDIGDTTSVSGKRRLAPEGSGASRSGLSRVMYTALPSVRSS